MEGSGASLSAATSKPYVRLHGASRAVLRMRITSELRFSALERAATNPARIVLARALSAHVHRTRVLPFRDVPAHVEDAAVRRHRRVTLRERPRRVGASVRVGGLRGTVARLTFRGSRP